MSNMDFWPLIMGDTDDDQSDFVGFSPEKVKLNRNEGVTEIESDVDIDWDRDIEPIDGLSSR